MTKHPNSPPQTALDADPTTQTPDMLHSTMKSAKQRSGLSYQMMANRLGVSKGVLWNYLVNGIEPENREIRRRLNLDVEGEWILIFAKRGGNGQFK